MAKNRNKKAKKDRAVSMDTSEATVSDVPQAMDTSESAAPVSASGVLIRKIKGRPMKRSKNVRKMKSVAKAISKSEQKVEKILKNGDKSLRTQSAKLLYECQIEEKGLSTSGVNRVDCRGRRV